MLKMKRYRLILKEDATPIIDKKKMLLTSTGFDNWKFARIVKRMLEYRKPLYLCNVLFIPTADRKEESVDACLKEIMAMGIPKYKIFFNYCNIKRLERVKYDMIYVTGGDENYLMDVLNKTGFKHLLLKMINNGVLYVGVSAGSYICGNMVDRPNQSLGLFDYIIEPHQNENNHPNGKINPVNGIVNISDTQAILVNNGKVRVIG